MLLALLLAAAPQLVVQEGHGGSVERLAISPDGKLLASAGTTDLRIWDLSSGLLLRTAVLPDCGSARLSFVKQGRAVAVGGSCFRDGETYDLLLDVATGATSSFKVVKSGIPGDGGYVGAYGQGGELLVQTVPAWLGKPERTEVWSVEQRKLLHTIPLELPRHGRLHALGRSAFAVCENDVLTFFDAEKASRLAGFPPITGPNCFFDLVPALSPDGQQMAMPIGEPRNTVVIKSAAGGERRFQAGEGSVNQLLFSADGKRLLLAGSVGKARSWTGELTLETGQLQRRDLVGGGGGVAWLLDESRLAITHKSSITLHAWKTGALERELPGSAATVTQIAFSPDSRLVAQSSQVVGEPAQVKVWDLATGRIVRAALVAADNDITGLAFTPDGQAVAWAERNLSVTVPKQKGIEVLELKTGARRRLLEDRFVDKFDFSPDGKWVGFAGRDKQRDPWTGAVVDRATGADALPLGSVHEVHFSADGALLAAGNRWGSEEGALYTVAGWKKLKAVKWGEVYLSPDLGQLARAASWGGLSLEPLADGVPVVKWNGGVKPKAKRGRRGGEEPIDPGLPSLPSVGVVAFSPDGKLAATGGRAGGHLVDLKTRAPLRDLHVEHPLYLHTAAFSADGSLLATGGTEGSLVLRDGHTGEPLATLLARDETEGVAVLPSGDYLASKGALKAIAFRVGMRAYPFEQFDLRFNRPDAVLRKLGRATGGLIEAAARARQKRLARAGFTEQMLSASLQLPEVEVDRAAIPASTAAPEVSLRIKARSPQALLSRLFVTVDDAPFDGRVAGVDLREKKSRTLEQEVTVPILPGRNRIQVSVLDAQGVESLRETLEVRGEGAPQPARLFVLSAGVSRYKNATYDLRYAAKDAQDLASQFARAPHFKGVEVATVLDLAATREGILGARQKLLEAGPADEVVVFLAGHGLLDDKLDYYFATTDIDFEHPAARGLSFEEVESLLDGVRARRKLLLMDTCNSGELDKADVEVAALVKGAGDPRVTARAVGTRGVRRKSSLGTGDLSALLGELFADTRRSSGAVAISSAGGAEYALESDQWKNGVFTFSLLEGLATGSADRDKNGFITAAELRESVQAHVRELTGGRQTPTSRRENLAVDFVVY